MSDAERQRARAINLIYELHTSRGRKGASHVAEPVTIPGFSLKNLRQLARDEMAAEAVDGHAEASIPPQALKALVEVALAARRLSNDYEALQVALGVFK